MNVEELRTEIARLQGQVDSYQEQMRSVSIQLLREQLRRLQDDNAEMRRIVESTNRAMGRLRADVGERLDKAGVAFAELQEELKHREKDNGQ